MSGFSVPCSGMLDFAEDRGAARNHRHADAAPLTELTGSELLTLRQAEEIERQAEEIERSANMMACRRHLEDLRAVYGIRIWK
jgi:hypothetical protein